MGLGLSVGVCIHSILEWENVSEKRSRSVRRVRIRVRVRVGLRVTVSQEGQDEG